MNELQSVLNKSKNRKKIVINKYYDLYYDTVNFTCGRIYCLNCEKYQVDTDDVFYVLEVYFKHDVENGFCGSKEYCIKCLNKGIDWAKNQFNVKNLDNVDFLEKRIKEHQQYLREMRDVGDKKW